MATQLTDEEMRRLYGPEKGHYDSDLEVFDQVAPLENQTQPDPTAAANAIGTAQVVHTINPDAGVNTETSPSQPADARQTYVDENNKANNAAYRDFYNYVNDIAARNRAEEARMNEQEQANQKAAFATGATELAANVINLLGVGGAHASNQQYHSYSQDWMRKADRDIRENRHRRDSMRNTLDRLRLQQKQIQNANLKESLDLQYKIQLAREAEAQKEADRQKAEEAALAKRDADMQTKGFIPDPNSETGYRFDPDLAREIALSKSSGKTTGQRSYNAYRTSPQSSSTPGQTGYVATADNAPSAVVSSPAQGGAKTVNTTPKPAQTVNTKSAQNSNGGKKRGSGRTTFLPPEQDVWERGIDLRNSPQGRKKVTPEPETTGKTKQVKDYSQYKVTV